MKKKDLGARATYSSQTPPVVLSADEDGSRFYPGRETAISCGDKNL